MTKKGAIANLNFQRLVIPVTIAGAPLRATLNRKPQRLYFHATIKLKRFEPSGFCWEIH